MKRLYKYVLKHVDKAMRGKDAPTMNLINAEDIYIRESYRIFIKTSALEKHIKQSGGYTKSVNDEYAIPEQVLKEYYLGWLETDAVTAGKLFAQQFTSHEVMEMFTEE